AWCGHPMSMRFNLRPLPKLVVAALAAVLVGWVPGLALAQPDPVSLTLIPSRLEVRPGDQLAIAVVLGLQPGWHGATDDPKIPKSWGDFRAFATEIKVDPIMGAKTGPPQWPVPTVLNLDLVLSGTPEPYAVYSDRAVSYVPVVIAPDAAMGPRSVGVHV